MTRRRYARRWYSQAIIAAAFGLLACGCGRHPAPVNVILIAVDALRPDHLGCYGYARNTSPNIDRLAAEGALFENAISQACWTTPSFGTIFSSLYPSQHGSMKINNMVRPTVPMLAEMLKARGYATGAFVNAPALNPEFGISRGFDVYDAARSEPRDAIRTTADALEWIDRHKQQPFFVFVHYFDVHLPYAPSSPYDNLFDPEYRGPLGNSFDPDVYEPSREKLLEKMGRWSAGDWNHVKSLYDGEIAFADKALGTFIEAIEERGLRKRTLIVLLSDHGEEFYEHGAYGHGHSLYDEVIRVPLIFLLPGMIPKGFRSKETARLLDVTPTILELVGLKSQVHFEGASLAGLICGCGPVRAEPGAVLPPNVAYSEAVRLGSEKKALTAYPYKVIQDMGSGETVGFNLAEDPAESRGLATDGPPLANVVRTMYAAVFKTTDTWHLEIATDGTPHAFDVAVASRRGVFDGEIYLARTIDTNGNYHSLEGIRSAPSSPGVLELRSLSVPGSLRLAFKVAPWRFPVLFDLKMDGRPAVGYTYLGASLARPESVPFEQHPGKKTCKSRGEPSARPAAPYILVWLYESAYQGETEVTLSDQTRKGLRSLGYVQ
ncbi:MAG: sulfatase [Candidatus Eisenbacteria bacterium]